MLKKFFKEMPKDDKFINAFCVGFSLLIAAVVAVSAHSSGVSLAVSLTIGLAIVLSICGYRFSLLWRLFKDSLDGSSRKSSCESIYLIFEDDNS